MNFQEVAGLSAHFRCDVDKSVHTLQRAPNRVCLLRTYCIQWSEAALVARGGNRVNAMVLLQSLEWSLRGQASALNRVLARLVDMGFNDMPARVCLLMNNGEEASALDDLLLNKVYVSVSGFLVHSAWNVGV